MRPGGYWLFAPLLSLILAALVPSPASESAAFQSGGMQAISIDMGVTGNTATSLGDRQECAEALPGDTLTVDITATDIPSDFPMIGYFYELRFDGPPLAITGQEPLMLAANPGSSIFSVSDPTPVFDAPFTANVVDINTLHVAGSGVLDRLTVEIATDAAPAIYQLRIQLSAHIDPANTSQVPATVNDARIAVGLSCASSTPIPSRTPDLPETETPTPPGASVTPTPSAMPETRAPTATATATPATPPNTTTPTPGGPAMTPASAGSGISSDGDSTTVIAVIGAVMAGMAAAGAAGWLAYRYAIRD